MRALEGNEAAGNFKENTARLSQGGSPNSLSENTEINDSKENFRANQRQGTSGEDGGQFW